MRFQALTMAEVEERYRELVDAGCVDAIQGDPRTGKWRFCLISPKTAH